MYKTVKNKISLWEKKKDYFPHLHLFLTHYLYSNVSEEIQEDLYDVNSDGHLPNDDINSAVSNKFSQKSNQNNKR